MLCYIAVIFLLFFLSFIRTEKNANLLLLSVLCIFLCFGYMTGSDWRIYEEEYYSHFQTRLVEPGYMLLSNLCANLYIDFWVFHIIIKVFCFFSVCLLLRKYTKNGELFFSFMLFCASFGFFLFIDCPFRNLISISIFLYGSQYLGTKSFFKYFLMVLLACSFHFSALYLFVLPFIRFDKIKTKYLFVIYFSFFVFLSTGGCAHLLSLCAYAAPTLYARLSFYEDTELLSSNLFSVGLILRFLCLFFMLYYRSSIVNGRHYGRLVFNMCFFYLLLSLASYSMPILFRLPFYLSPFYVIMICYCLQRFHGKNFLIVKTTYLMISLVITITTVTSRAYYVPYSNILFYVIGDNSLDYNYRSNYNFNHSPYK